MKYFFIFFTFFCGMNQINLTPLFTNIPTCQWSASNQYFSDTETLKNIGYIEVFDTDIYVETSFFLPGRIGVAGASIQTFTKDNTEDQNFLIYRLAVPHIKTQDMLTVEITSQNIISMNTIKNFITSMPWASFIIFNILLLFLPVFIGTIMHILDIAALLLVGSLYAYRIAQFVLRKIKIKKVIVAGKNIQYQNDMDREVLEPRQILALAALESNNIDTVVINNGVMYVKQIFTPPFPWEEALSPDDTIKQIENTIEIFRSDAFISSFDVS